MGFNRGQFNKVRFNLPPGGAVSSTCAGKYDIIQYVSKSLTGKYSVSIPTEIEAKYDLGIGKTLTGIYDITLCIEKGLDGTYDISLSAIVEGLYDIPHSASLIGISSIDIPSPIEAIYHILTGQSIAGNYDIIFEGFISKNLQGLFNISINRSLKGYWNTLTARSLDGVSSILLEKEFISFYDLTAGNSLTGIWNTLISDQIAGRYRIWDGPMDISASIEGGYSIQVARLLKGTAQINRYQSFIGLWDISSTYGNTKGIIGLYDIESDYITKSVIGLFSTCVNAECISSYNIAVDGTLASSYTIPIGMTLVGPYFELYAASYRTLWDIFRLPDLIGRYDISGPLPDAPREITARYDIEGVIYSSLTGLAEIKGTITNAGKYILDFREGDSRLVGGMVIHGAISAARGQIGSVTTLSGSWTAGTAAGFILFDWVSGQFIPGESLIIEA